MQRNSHLLKGKLMQPVNKQRLDELIAEIEASAKPVPQIWAVGLDGEPYWSQEPSFVPMIQGMTLHPRPDVPEYRIVNFESSDNHDIQIIRVVQCGTTQEKDAMEELELNRKPSRAEKAQPKMSARKKIFGIF